MVISMKTVFDVRQILKRFGTFIYTSDRLGDLELMELEIDELYHAGFLPIKEYQLSKLILKREVAQVTKRNEGK